MLNNKIVVALLAAGFAAAQEIERNDIPQDCRSICEPVLDIARRCDVENDQQERNCICEAANSASFETCNECTLRYPDFFIDIDNDDDDEGDRIENEDNEVNIWYNRCAFGGSSSTGTMTAAPTATPSMSTGVYTTTVCDDDANEDNDDDDVCETRVVTGVVPVMATTTGTASTTLLTGTSTSQTGGAAAATGTEENNDSDDGTDTNDNNNNNNDNNDNNDSGAMSMTIPMIGAGFGAIFAAMAAL